jgi:hypothetical protein
MRATVVPRGRAQAVEAGITEGAFASVGDALADARRWVHTPYSPYSGA